MWILSSESRGVEFASESKKRCEQERKRLMQDDRENGYVDTYYIDYEANDDGFWKEGLQ